MFGLMRTYPQMYNPFRELDALEKAFFSDAFTPSRCPTFRTDITDAGDHYLLEADLPGFEKKDIRLELKDNTLKVQAQHNRDTQEKDSNDKIIYRERTRGTYERSFDITGIDPENIKASYKNGVLQLTLPKLKAPESKFLEIE